MPEINLSQSKNVIAVFLAGCRRGFKLSVEQVMPAMILGYAFIQFLKLSGAMKLFGVVFKPIMSIFGLPGESVAVLISAFFAKASGCSAAAALYTQGVLNLTQVTILFPACILMGTLVGHYARIVLVSEANRKWHKVLLLVPIVDAAIGMLLTRLLLAIFKIA